MNAPLSSLASQTLKGGDFQVHFRPGFPGVFAQDSESAPTSVNVSNQRISWSQQPRWLRESNVLAQVRKPLHTPDNFIWPLDNLEKVIAWSKISTWMPGTNCECSPSERISCSRSRSWERPSTSWSTVWPWHLSKRFATWGQSLKDWIKTLI